MSTATATESCDACGSMIVMVDQVGSSAKLALDVDRDPAGAYIAERRGNKWPVRLVRPGEVLDPTRPRHSAHNDACPGKAAARGQKSTRHGGRSNTAGPCSLCRTTIPNRYGPESTGPLCDECKALTPARRTAGRHAA